MEPIDVNLCVTDSFEHAASTIRASMFEQMVKLATDPEDAERPTSYLSDLWHDAVWLDHGLVGEMTFYWGFGASGTFIGTDRSTTDWVMARAGRPRMWRVTVAKANRQGWGARFTPMAAPAK